MKDFFDRIQEFINGAQVKATDLVEKYALALEAHIAWVRAQNGPAPMMATAPADAARLQQCLTDCQALAAPVKGAGPQAVGGPFAGLLAKLIAALLAALK